MSTLSRSEHKALALHRAIVARLRAAPELRQLAKARLGRLGQMNPASAPYYTQWMRLLDAPLDDLFTAMLDASEKGCALRQESPFGDVINQRERAAIYRETAARLDATRL